MDFMLFQTPFHPLQLFGAQVLATSLVIGFSTPHSFLRPAILPLIALCAYGIVSTSKNFMRLHWASLLSGTTNGFLLQYIELALLSRWSYETKRDVFELHHDGFWERLYFGFLSTFSFRSVNTRLEVRNVPAFKNGPPSRSVFVLRQIVITIMCILVVDVSGAQPPPPNAAELFSPAKVQFFTRLSEITRDEMMLRILSTLIYWANMYAIMQGVTSAAATLAVGSGTSEVKAWRPFFGSPASASDLRGFWGYVYVCVLFVMKANILQDVLASDTSTNSVESGLVYNSRSLEAKWCCSSLPEDILHVRNLWNPAYIC